MGDQSTQRPMRGKRDKLGQCHVMGHPGTCGAVDPGPLTRTQEKVQWKHEVESDGDFYDLLDKPVYELLEKDGKVRG